MSTLFTGDDESIPSSRPGLFIRRRRDENEDEASSARFGTATFIELLERAYSEDD